MLQGSEPPNMPRATAAMRVACGASSGFGCATVGTPMPYAAASRFSTGAMTRAQTTAPTASITCCFQGVAPIM